MRWRQPGVAPQADADDRNLRHAGFRLHDIVPISAFKRSSTTSALSTSPEGNREGHVGELARLRDVLDDHIDIDVASASGPRDAAGPPGPSPTRRSEIWPVLP